VEIFIIWPASLFVVAGLLGLLVGSFLNVVAHRLPIMMELEWRSHCDALNEQPDSDTAIPPDVPAAFSLWRPRSACPSCGHLISAWQNIPVVSYLLLRGRCAGCKTPISIRYPVVEAAAGLLSLLVALRFGATPQVVAGLGFTWAVLVLAVIDIDRQLLPDSITLPLVWFGLLISLVGDDGLFVGPATSIIGAVAGYLSLWLVFHLFKLITGKEGMGYGDFKLLAAIGAWVGWQLLPLVILLSAVVGSIVGVGLIVFGNHARQTPIPFGPYLAAAGWIALLWGPELLSWYSAFGRS
jgi:leader peptidase (prepilin peptidase)/N-methyltransferase